MSKIVDLGQEIIELAEEFVDEDFGDFDTYSFAKGLNFEEARKLKEAVEILVRYQDVMPDDIADAVKRILQFALEVGEKPEDKDEDENKDEDGKVKKEVTHSWGFRLIDSEEIEKQNNQRRRRRKKSGAHSWGFSLSDNDEDIEKEGDEDDEEDEVVEGDE